MAEASSTKNMDVCIVDENEIINTSQKQTTSALVTITQKKAKSKTILRSRTSSYLWLGFHALNLLNKEKNLPMETEETTTELLKKIDFDEAKEIQSARPSFPYVPQKEWPSKREDGIEGQHYNFHSMWKLMRMVSLVTTKSQFTLSLVTVSGKETLLCTKSKKD